MKQITMLGLIVAALFVGTPGHASDMTGIYGNIINVAFFPNAENPTTVKISGTFATSLGVLGTGGYYGAPQSGFLYYKVNESSDAKLSIEQWKKMAALAGTKKCVGFGERGTYNGEVRQASWPVAGADEYPLGDTLHEFEAADCKLVTVDLVKQ